MVGPDHRVHAWIRFAIGPQPTDYRWFVRDQAIPTVALIRDLPTTGRPLAEAAIPGSADLVERLRDLLQAGDGEAIDLVKAHRASLQRLLGAASFQAMESELERVALEAAAAVLEAATPAAPALASPGSGDSP